MRGAGTRTVEVALLIGAVAVTAGGAAWWIHGLITSLVEVLP